MVLITLPPGSLSPTCDYLSMLGLKLQKKAPDDVVQNDRRSSRNIAELRIENLNYVVDVSLHSSGPTVWLLFIYTTEANTSFHLCTTVHQVLTSFGSMLSHRTGFRARLSAARIRSLSQATCERSRPMREDVIYIISSITGQGFSHVACVIDRNWTWHWLLCAISQVRVTFLQINL